MRIEGSTVEADKFGAGKDGFQRGNPLTLDPSTIVTEEWLDAHQEYVVRVFEDLKIDVPTVQLPDHDLLLRALDTRAFKVASANWKAAEPTFAGICLGAGFAQVPNVAGGYDNDQWVLVGDAAFDINIFTDGDLHSQLIIGSALVWNDVIHAFGPGTSGRWIRVGDGGEIYSTAAALATGANWTSRTSGTPEDLRGLGIKGSAEVLAVGDDGDWCHSTDGVTWTTGSEGTGIVWKACAWHDGNWYAVGIASGGADGVISKSPDHINWTHDSSFTAHKFTDIVADGTTVHAVTEDGRAYSLIGGTWTITLNNPTLFYNSIDFDGAGYVIATSTGDVLTAHQSNLGQPNNWVLRKPALTNPDFRVVRAGAGRWVVGGAGGGIVKISDARF